MEIEEFNVIVDESMNDINQFIKVIGRYFLCLPKSVKAPEIFFAQQEIDNHFIQIQKCNVVARESYLQQ